jgi:uncharacterized damage-inducible protein DinB
MQPPYVGFASNNAWANRTLYAAFARLPGGGFTAARPGFFPSLAATMNHILVVDLYYIDALTGGGFGRAVFDRPRVDDPDTLGAAQAEADTRLLRLCLELYAADLDRVVTTDRRDGPVTERVGDLLPHLFQHQIHHRGQAHVQLSHAGVAPPQLDEFFLTYDRAPTAEEYPR